MQGRGQTVVKWNGKTCLKTQRGWLNEPLATQHFRGRRACQGLSWHSWPLVRIILCYGADVHTVFVSILGLYPLVRLLSRSHQISPEAEQPPLKATDLYLLTWEKTSTLMRTKAYGKQNKTDKKNYTETKYMGKKHHTHVCNSTCLYCLNE